MVRWFSSLAKIVTRSELRKVRSIATIIGQEHLQSLLNIEYKVVNGLYVYSSKNDDKELVISIWSEPRENKSSRCLFSDRIGTKAYIAALDYWRPSFRSSGSE